MIEAVPAHLYMQHELCTGIFFSRLVLFCAQTQIFVKFKAWKSQLLGKVCGTQARLDPLVGPLCAVGNRAGISTAADL